MIPLESLPHSNVLQILQKMELKTWVLSRMTGPFIFDFVQENSRKFNFPCPIANICFRFGNYPFISEIFLSDEGYEVFEWERRITIEDPEVSLAGLCFYQISMIELTEPCINQSNDEFQKYLETRLDILHNRVLPAVRIVKNRAEWLFTVLNKEDVEIAVEASGCSKLYDYKHYDYMYNMDYSTWIDNPKMRALTHLNLYRVSVHGIPSLVRRFNYFETCTSYIGNELRDLLYQLKQMLKDLGKSAPLSGPRRVLLKSRLLDNMECIEGIECLNHRILFQGHIKHPYFNVLPMPTSNFIVILVEETNFFGVMTIIHDDPNEDENYPKLQHYIEFSPSFDSEKVALFFLERAAGLHPVDISELHAKLKKGTEIDDILTQFLLMCHSDDLH